MRVGIFRNMSWIILGNGMAAVLSFFSAVLVSRSLSLSDFGYFQLIYTYFMFVQCLENMAHANVIKLIFHQNIENKNKAIVSTFAILFGLFSIVTLVVLSLALLFEARYYFILVSLLVGQLFRSLVGLSYFFDYSLDSIKTQITTIVNGATAGGARVLTSGVSGDLRLQGSSFSLGALLSLFCWLFFSRKWFSILEIFKAKNYDRGMIWQIMKSSLPLWMIATLHFFLFKLDVIILGAIGDKDSVAIYSNAVRLTEPWSFVVGALSTSLFPIFLQKRKNSVGSYYKLVGWYFRMLIYGGTAMAVFLSCFAEPIVLFLYGDKYISSSNVLKWHAFNLVPFFLVVGLQVFDVLESLKRFSVIKFVIAVIVAGGINILLIPHLGIYACVLASFVSYTMLAIGLNAFNSRSWRLTIVGFKSFKYFKNDLKDLKNIFKRVFS